MKENPEPNTNSKTLIQKIISRAIETKFVIWLSNTRIAAFIIRSALPSISKKFIGDGKVITRPIVKEIGDELDTELTKIAKDIVLELGYVAAMVASYEQGDVLPARAFYINPDIATIETIKDWEAEIGKYTSKPVSITNPDIARVYRYKEEDKANLSIRAIEAEKPLMTDEIYDLFRPIAPEASRHLVNTVQKTFGINKLIAIPFFIDAISDDTSDREVVGNLFVATKETTFEQKEIKILTAFAQQAASTIEGIYKQRSDKLVRRLVLTMQANLSDEKILLQRIAESLVKEFGYAGAMVASYEKGDVLPVRAFFVDEKIATAEQLASWEQEVSKYSPKPVSITNPDIARVYRYKEEDKANLSIRAIEAEKPLATNEIYDLFRPIAPESSREIINTIQKNVGIQKLIAVPFFLEREEGGKITRDVLGNLFTATRSKSFSQGEIELFQALGQQAAAGIRNARILKYANDRKDAAQNFAKMAFAATAYLHELRNHIGAFRLHLQLLQMYAESNKLDEQEELDNAKTLDLKKQLERNNEILSRVKRVSEILDTLHEPWKRVEEKNISVNKCLARALEKVFSLSGAISAINEQEFKYRIGVDDIHISKAITNELPTINVSDDMLIEAFRIIVKNAVDALLKSASNEKSINVESHSNEDKFIIVTIQDNGTGIAPENLEKIFEYGYSTSEVGMGFGLYWAKDFVEGIGGSIHIDSVLQKGTTFTIKLPIKSANIIVLNS